MEDQELLHSVCEELRRIVGDYNNKNEVSSETFIHVLKRYGLQDVHDPRRKEIILSCQVLDNGRVNFQELVERAQTLSKENMKKSNNSSIPQKEWVYLLKDKLLELFSQYDKGAIALFQLRNEIDRMGLTTTAFKTLLSKKPTGGFTLYEFMTSLGDTSDKDYLHQQQQQQHHEAAEILNFPSSSSSSSFNSAKSLSNLNVALGGYQKTPTKKSTSINESPLTPTIKQVDMSGSISALIRQQVFELIRELDTGVVGVVAFEDRLKRLGIPIPSGVQRLLANHRASGNVSFRDFVREFEPFFHSLPKETEKREQVASTTNTSAIDKDVSIKPKIPIGKMDHGDLFGWTNSPNDLEKRDQMRRSRKYVPGPSQAEQEDYKPSRRLYHEKLSDHDIFSLRPVSNTEEILAQTRAIDAGQLHRHYHAPTLPFGTERDLFELERSSQKRYSVTRVPFGTEADNIVRKEN